MDLKKVLQSVTDRYKTDNEMDSVGKGLGDVAKQINEYKSASAPVSPTKHSMPAPTDKMHPQAKYGDQPGEQRINTDQMVKPLGQMHQGGPVKKTGAYILKKGEHVLTPEQKKSQMALAETVLSHSHEDREPEQPVKKIHEMRIRHGKSGGHIIEHHHTEPMHHKMEEHTTADTDGLVDHVMQHMTPPNEGEAEADAGQSGAPGAMPPSAGTQQMAQAIGGA